MTAAAAAAAAAAARFRLTAEEHTSSKLVALPQV
jgi:hypothetical protein